MKKSLSLKLFVTIALSFVIMISCIILSIYIYFSSFYEKQKVQSMVDSINAFSEDYQQNDWNEEELYRQIGLFSSANNAELTVSREEGEHSEGEANVVLITTVDQDNAYYDFFVSVEVYQKLGLKIGDQINLKGSLKEGGIIVPASINNMVIESTENENGEHGEAGDDSEENSVYVGQVKIADIKKNLSLPSFEEETTQYNVLYSSVKNGVTYTASEMPHTSVKQVNFVKEITNTNGAKAKLHANVSLQPIEETLAFVQNFFPYFLVFSLLLALIIALIYSKSVSKPILKIANTADNMANMDFSKKLYTSRQDELGKLSTSLNTLSANLENALGELTVANEKLKEDFEREIKQEQARKEFIANASHELKTPLGIIKGYADGIKDGINKEERAEYIDVISDEISKMDRLILEMIRISKYDSMDMEINRQKTALLILVNDIVQTFEHHMARRNLLLDITGDFGICDVDKEKIQTAFSNLFGNAVKYAESDSKIIVNGSIKDQKNRIEIYNRCRPFTKEQLDKVWERFYRADTSHSKEIEGSGLGLSIVKSIFDAHKMDYGVFNRGNGVVFWFEMRLAKEVFEPVDML